MNIDGLLVWLRSQGDRVPRRVIEECARRGDAMAERLAGIIRDADAWDEYESEEQWLHAFHAVHVLGLMDSALAGEALTHAMRCDPDDVGGSSLGRLALAEWPAFFRNKPAQVLIGLSSRLQDRSEGSHARTCAMYVLLEHAVRTNEQPLEELLDAIAALAGNAEEDLDFRLLAGDTLLDFPRPRHRELLRQLAEHPCDFHYFDTRDVEEIYAEGCDIHVWDKYTDPWRFYEPAALHEREQEREQLARRHAYASSLPLVRETPKVGRNDPCPCGSGKKYKKCCLDAER